MTLLDRLGGEETAHRLSDALYERLLADDEIGPKFAETHMATQRQRLAEYLIAVFSESSGPQSARLRAAHRPHDVNDRHFSILASTVADLLDEWGTDPDTAADVLDLVASLRADVVSESHVAGEWDAVDPDT